MSAGLIANLRRWADARDRRYEADHPHGAHGKTGTARLRDAADVIEEQDKEISRLQAERDAIAERLVFAETYGPAAPQASDEPAVSPLCGRDR